MSDTFIGRNIENNTIVEIGNIERRSGLYILGNPGTGKSNLMESMIITDIQKGSGVFFLDPHGEAIDKIIKHLTTNNTASIIILDPEDEKYSFGINPLSC